ncbi:hypothetical protein KSS87_004134 [Heliosperma pusillum]|nr:hypothetical protein KSS87_004134 [Heliosperma pusillum]
MMDVIKDGPTTVFLMGAHTNFALFLMSNPHLKKNVQHIYISGGGVRSQNPTGCCPNNGTTPCKPEQCGDRGNIFTGFTSNPYAEFNMFGDPFAAYQVIHSGIPVTLIPLDATNTIPITGEFFVALETHQKTYEAQYVFKSLKLSYFMWDSFMAGVAVSIMSGEYEFAEMEYMNITVRTSNEPYGITGSSNPFFDGRTVPKFHLEKGGVHSGHVQRSLRDPFCLVENGKGKCKDGYTEEVKGPDGVRVLVATRAKPNKDPNSLLDREYFENFLHVLDRPQQSGKFNFSTQFPNFKEVLYRPDFGSKMLGKPTIFDMDMSPGDFLALLYLLKLPVEVVNLRAIFVTPTGWANAATIDIVYDLLHMMGRDDIPVGMGDLFAVNQSDPAFAAVGDCKYIKSIPHGSGGFLDSDTLYGLARDLPRSPRRYTAENSVKFGAPRDTDHPELRQPLALEIWANVSRTIPFGTKITVLTNGPLTTLSKILASDKHARFKIQEVFMVGGNMLTVPSNENAEHNMFLDPLAAKAVMDSKLQITLIPWEAQRTVSSFPSILKSLALIKKTPELIFAHRLISTLEKLRKTHIRYHHVEIFAGEILGAVLMANGQASLKFGIQVKPIRVMVTDSENTDVRIVTDHKYGRFVNIVEEVDNDAYYDLFASRLGAEKQSAVISSFSEQSRIWRGN